VPFLRQAPEQPPNLSPEAKAEWERIVQRLAALNVLTPAHQTGLMILCESWAEYQQAQARVAEEGLILRAPNGRPYRHPCVAIAWAAQREYRAWAAEFGLTLSAEGRIDLTGLPSPEDDDDDLELD
jgi:P27 family predicted phage terminase small subunit